MSDPAGWYPDPTTRHELRYWDGYAWMDNVSDAGVSATDPLGGKPMPRPSEAAAKAQAPSPPAEKSKAPLYIGGAVAAVLVIAAAAILVTRGDGDDKVTTLGDEPVTFEDEAPDAVHPLVHPVKVSANTVVLIEVSSDAEDLEPGVIVMSSQALVDSVAAKIEGARDLLNRSLRDACFNLREEDIGAKGTVVLSARRSGEAGTELKDFIEVPVDGEYEFIPVLVDEQQTCIAGKTTMTLEAEPFDFGDIDDLDELQSSESESPVLSDFFSS